MPQQIGYLRQHRRRVRGDAPIDIGMNTDWLYVGRPAFEVPPGTRTGSGEALAATLREVGALGVNHLGVRFRARSCDELVDQIDAFGRDVAPHLAT
jgi:hypothetical protein